MAGGAPARQLSDLLESRPLSRISRKQRFPTHYARALRIKEHAPVWCEKGRAGRAPIEFQKKPAVRFEESRAHIVNEKFPVSLRPFQPFTVFAPRNPVKKDAMGRDQIEFFSEIGQRLPGIDSRDGAANAEELGRPAEKRFVIG